MAQEYKVMATGRNSIHVAGIYTAESVEEAETMAKEDFRRSLAGSIIREYGLFKFFASCDCESKK